MKDLTKLVAVASILTMVVGCRTFSPTPMDEVGFKAAGRNADQGRRHGVGRRADCRGGSSGLRLQALQKEDPAGVARDHQRYRRRDAVHAAERRSGLFRPARGGSEDQLDLVQEGEPREEVVLLREPDAIHHPAWRDRVRFRLREPEPGCAMGAWWRFSASTRPCTWSSSPRSRVSRPISTSWTGRSLRLISSPVRRSSTSPTQGTSKMDRGAAGDRHQRRRHQNR